MKIRTKLLISVLAAVIAVFAAIMWLSSTTSRRALVNELQQRAQFALKAYSGTLDSSIGTLEDVATSLAIAVEALDPSSEEGVKKLIAKTVELEPFVFGSTIAYEPGTFPGREGSFAPYYHRGKEGLVEVSLATTAYNYPEQAWYLVPRETKKGWWTDPYIDVGGGDVAMVTYAHPIMRGDAVRGVATVDIALEDLTREIAKAKVGRTGFAFLLSRKGTFLTARTGEWKLKRTLEDVAAEFKSDELKQLSARMLAGETGFRMMDEPVKGEKAWFAFGPIAKTGWSLGLVFPEAEMMEEITALNRRMLAIGAAGLFAISLLIYLIARRVSRPISLLAKDARRIAAGDLAVAPPVRAGKDEIGVLTRAFAEMARSLSRMIEKLRSEKELFSAAFAQMSDGIVILDTDFMPVQFNLTAERLLGLPVERSIVEHLLARFTCTPPLERIADFSKGPPAFELTRPATEKTTALHLVMIATPIRNRDGELVSVVLALRDVTEFRAEELSKKDFLSTISHKLRTPVAVLQSSAFLIRDGMLGELNEKQQKHAGTMADQAARLAALIEELISFVTLEEQALSTSKERIELQPFLEGITGECWKLHPDCKAELTIGVAPDAAAIDFHREYLRLVVCELLQNAVKFNANEKPAIAIRCTREGTQIAIAVADNGVGIPPELHDKIFEKFYQAERYFTGNVEGVGLGLAFVKKIVDFAGGTIEVESQPGKGSTFTVRLPA